MKQYLKKNLPKPLLNFLKAVRKLYKLIRHRSRYKKIKIKLFIAGVYFSIFKKVYKNKGIVLNIPYHLTDYKFRGRFQLNLYEVEEAKYIDQYLSKNAKVLELGGCLGYVSCLINKKLEDKTQQVTLEANPKLINWIEKNRDANNCEFIVENSIVSPTKDNTFYFHKLIVGGSTKRKTQSKINIKGFDIKHYEKKYNIKFDTLVMDIEGGELELIKTFKDTLSNFKTLFIEVHPFGNMLTKQEVKTCEDILSSIGFNLTKRDGNFQIWNKKTL